MLADPLDPTLIELFEAWARREPGHEAVCTEQSSLSYQRVSDLADRVAAAAVAAGVRPGDRVVLIFSARPEAVAALLGVVKAGAIAVPLNSSAPAAQLQQVVAHAEPACVLTESASWSIAAGLTPVHAPVLDVDALDSPAVHEWPRLDAAAPCVLLYTSGSTGTPKGVLQSHRSIIRKILAAHAVLQTAPHDRFTLFSTYAVGQGLTVVFGALLHGATVCMFDVRRHGFDRLAAWLAEQRISIYQSSASLFRSLARTAGARLTCPSLRLIRLGSERVTGADIDAARRLFRSGVTFVVSYGSTETSTISFHIVEPGEEFDNGLVPVGPALPGLRVSIVDDEGRELPQGTTGEIAVQGRDLPLGYFRDDALTAARYQAAVDAPGERRYLTGDLGRLRPDGQLEHLGRKDRRVKVRGFRIELDEIEHTLLQHPGVARVAVEAVPDRRGDLMLVAYVEPTGPAAASAEDFRAFLSQRLADYKVPSRFIALARLPISDSGKIVRSRLPPVEGSQALTGTPLARAETSLQALVSAAWIEVLGDDGIGIDDPFLMVGGDSLRAAQIASRLSRVLGTDVPLTLLLEAETIRRLAERLEGLGPA